MTTMLARKPADTAAHPEFDVLLTKVHQLGREVVAAMLEAQRSFRRIKGCHDMPAFVAAVHHATNSDAVTPANYAQVA